jgi:hypothetical protein
MHKLTVLFLAVICCPAAAPAQQTKPAAPAKIDVFVGYSYSRAFFADVPPSPLSMNGGEVSLTYFPGKHYGVTADFAGWTESTNNVSSLSGLFTGVDALTVNTESYLFGPTVRFGLKGERYRPVSFFAHQLFGFSHFTATVNETGYTCNPTSVTCTANPFTSVTGGGMDVQVKKYLSLRPVQLDFWSMQLSLDALSAQNEDGLKLGMNGFRYSTGAVIHF